MSVHAFINPNLSPACLASITPILSACAFNSTQPAGSFIQMIADPAFSAGVCSSGCRNAISMFPAAGASICGDTISILNPAQSVSLVAVLDPLLTRMNTSALYGAVASIQAAACANVTSGATPCIGSQAEGLSPTITSLKDYFEDLAQNSRLMCSSCGRQETIEVRSVNELLTSHGYPVYVSNSLLNSALCPMASGATQGRRYSKASVSMAIAAGVLAGLVLAAA